MTNGINPHYWRKMKQAEAHVMRFFARHGSYNRRQYRRACRWAGQFRRNLDKIFNT